MLHPSYRREQKTQLKEDLQRDQLKVLQKIAKEFP